MKENEEYFFYALTTDGATTSIHETQEEVIKVLSDWLKEDSEASYKIDSVDGIWEYIKRLGEFEDYSDRWMEEVVSDVYKKIQEVKSKREQTSEN